VAHQRHNIIRNIKNLSIFVEDEAKRILKLEQKKKRTNGNYFSAIVIIYMNRLKKSNLSHESHELVIFQKKRLVLEFNLFAIHRFFCGRKKTVVNIYYD
jgi:hypothetical protein